MTDLAMRKSQFEMKGLGFGLLLVVSIWCVESSGFHVGLTASSHIIGGREAQPHAYPYQVILAVRHNVITTVYCGASLISAKWLLTAAHCVNVTSYMSIHATFGAHWLYDFEEVREAESLIVHPDFDLLQVKNDIALVRVEPVKFIEGIIAPVRLPSLSQRKQSFQGWPVTVTGWGRTSDRSFLATDLRTMSTVVAANKDCTQEYKRFNFVFTEDYICTSGAGRKGICEGDSGGPMVIKEEDGNYTLIGVSSFTPEEGCETSIPSGFVRVTSYLDWIYNQTGIKSRI